ncbi:unknown similar to AMEV225 [Adoxophyes honmai entomopoxvirus 'L']|uniref:Uncharacterized protein n=1 Tax=Adoxophyes honmai entomopoxvirus 'L' TaxID=1293540 RepID=A0A916KP95_9POXV|nr:unknown similar to AMEV225 [Adoxophyes honmai entomopoxvirus 'L']CCU55524.1 unknown similar to AMEV225 [Adoxophyes honmai entomopoxvirus 'L']
MNKKYQYLGFSLSKELSETSENIYIRNKIFSISNFKLINFIYSDNEFLLSEQSTIYSKDPLLSGEFIFNSKNEYIGIITNKLENRYPISQKNDSIIRINNIYNVNIKNQEFPIVYADKEFPDNHSLINYLKLEPQKTKREISIFKLFMKTIIIIHENERNLGEIILNKPCISEYLFNNSVLG